MQVQARPARWTLQVRHRHKYFDLPVPAQSAFVFTRKGEDIGIRARSLKQLVAALKRLPDEVLDGHLHRHDFSRWIDEVLGDYVLADSLRDLEKRRAAGRAIDVGRMIAKSVEERYALPLEDVGGEVGPARSATTFAWVVREAPRLGASFTWHILARDAAFDNTCASVIRPHCLAHRVVV